MNLITENEAIKLIFAEESTNTELEDVYRRLKFKDIESADRNLQSLAGEADEREILSKFIYQLLLTISDSPDPDKALINWSRFTDAILSKHSFFIELLEDPSIITYLTLIFSSSQFLSDILIRNPEYFDWLIFEGNLRRDKTCEDFQEEASSLMQVFKKRDSARNALCRLKRREILRIALRDLLGITDFKNIVSELTYLADSIITVAVDLCYEEMVRSCGRPICEKEELKGKESCYSVVALGKLGGYELNFSSDIDLMFIYEDEGETDGIINGEKHKEKIITNHQFFCKLTERVINLLSEAGKEGVLYRTDIRLRPEGDRGPIARSIDSYRIYYFTQGRIWEKLALLKARCICGDIAFHKSFYELADAFKYSDINPAELITETIKLKEMIDGQLKNSDEYYREVKRGYGGIREIEFICGVFQLLFGGDNRELRCLSTLDTLQKLKKLKKISEIEEDSLRNSYVFLRTVEHRLQVVNELQAHTIPKDRYELRRLAKRMNIDFSNDEEAEHMFMSKYRKVTDDVHNIYQKVLKKEKIDNKSYGIEILFDDNAGTNEIFTLLKRYSFVDVESVHRILRSLLFGSRESYVSNIARKSFESVLQNLLEFCSNTPFPDKAITFFEEFVESYKARDYIYQMVEANPKLLELLIRVFGTSDFLSRQMIAHPEIFDMIAEPELLSLTQSIEEKEKALRANLKSFKTLEDKLTYLRKERKLNVILIGINDLLEIINWEEVSNRLSELAKLFVKIVFELTKEKYEKKYGVPESRICLIAMGKLGGNEITYHSDLDIVSVYSSDGYTNGAESIDNFTYFSKLTSNVVSSLSEMGEEGYIYKVDMRLRPEGKNSPITALVERYYDYYKNKAMLWEYQSFLKASYLAGDESLADEFIKNVRNIIVENVSKFNLKKEIVSMRKRLEGKEKLSQWALSHIKNGRGGISDIDFIVQYLQLKNYESYSDVFEANTFQAIKKLCELNILDESSCQELQKYYGFLRHLDNRTRLIFYPQYSLFPEEEKKGMALNKSIHKITDDTTSLKKLFIDYTAKVRNHFTKIVS